MRREDYQPPQPRNPKLLMLFNLSCVKCNSVNLKFISEFDDDCGETAVYGEGANCCWKTMGGGRVEIEWYLNT